MRWFKHFTDLADDKNVACYLDDCGKSAMEGYGAYLRLLEVVGKEISKDNIRCEAIYSLSMWSRLLYMHHNKVGKYMGKMEVSGLIVTFTHQKKLGVRISDLLRIKDDYLRKSGQSPDKIRTRSEVSPDVEQEQESKEKIQKENYPQNATYPHAQVLDKRSQTSMLLTIHGNKQQQNKPGGIVSSDVTPGAALQISQSHPPSVDCEVHDETGAYQIPHAPVDSAFQQIPADSAEDVSPDAKAGVSDKASSGAPISKLAASALSVLCERDKLDLLAFVDKTNHGQGDDFVLQAVWWVTEYSKQKTLKCKLSALEGIILKRRYNVSGRYKKWRERLLCGSHGYSDIESRPPDKESRSAVTKLNDLDAQTKQEKNYENFKKHLDDFAANSCGKLSQIN